MYMLLKYYKEKASSEKYIVYLNFYQHSNYHLYAVGNAIQSGSMLVIDNLRLHIGLHST